MTSWFHTCHVRLGIRPEDDLPRLVATKENPTAGVSGIEAFADDAGFSSVGVDVVPYNAQVELNSYMKADTAKFQIPLSRLPVDPRDIRQLQIQIFGGVISHEEAAARGRLGSSGGSIELFAGVDEDPLTGNSYELFRGFVQTYRLVRGEKDYIECNAVDLTAIFTAAQLYEDPLRGIPKTARIDQVIQLVLYGDGIQVKDASKRFGLPGARGTIIVNETGATLPTLADIHPPDYFDSKGGAKKSSSGGSKKKISFWDLITDLCKSAGLWCYIRAGSKPVLTSDGRSVIPGAELVITTPRTFYAARDAQVSDNPTVRRFIDGDNIDEYEIERNYNGEAQPTAIEVRAYDPSLRRTRFARYPKIPYMNRPASKANQGDRTEIMVFNRDPISGPEAVKILCQTAVSLYEQRARNEMTVRIRSETTMSALPSAPSRLSDGSYNPNLADMFWLRPGDPIQIEALPPDLTQNVVGTRLIFGDLPRERLIAEYQQAGLPAVTAAQLANATLSPYRQRFFRTIKVGWHWKYPEELGEDGGWSWDLEAQNYLDVRNAPDVLTDACAIGVGRG